MPYIGQQPTNVAFLTDTFSGNGSTTAFTLSAAPANTSSILVAISGVLQDPSTYSVSGTTLTFSPAPPTGTGNISVRFLGIPASGVTTTAYRTVTEFTATSGQTTFSVPSYTPGFIDVYRNGVMLGSADYTATSGLSVVLANPCTVGDFVEVISFQVSSLLNAIQATAGSVGTTFLADNSVTTAKIAPGAVIPADLSTGAPTWNTSGNLGIGTSSPSFNLDIGNVSSISNFTQRIVSGASNAAMARYDLSGTGTFTVGFNNSGSIVNNAPSGVASLWMQQSYPIIFGTAGTERMRIDSSGNLLVGSTTTQNNNRLYVQSNNFMVGINGTNTSGEMVRFYSNGSVAGTISYTASTVAYNTSSDYRLKEDIAPMTGALAKVQALKPVTYKWKIDGSNGQGFIAHELQEVVPECVTGEKDAVDADGNPEYQGIDTSFLVATLTAAIQEQQDIINDLKDRIELLENK